MFFKTQVGLSLCVICLKEFYNLYDNEGTGIITNHQSGSLLYDLIIWAGNEVEIEKDIKATIWKDCCEDYEIIHNRAITDKEKHKELRQDLYKARLIEYWLNKMADIEKRILPSDINIPKLNAHYHKFRLLRED
jgi:hypothetical protein